MWPKMLRETGPKGFLPDPPSSMAINGDWFDGLRGLAGKLWYSDESLVRMREVSIINHYSLRTRITVF